MDALKTIRDSIPENRVNIQEAKVVPMPKPKVSTGQGKKHAQRMPESLKAEVLLNDIKLDYSVHQSTGQIVVKVINAETGKVIREIPPKEILAIAEAMRKLEGLLLDQNM